MTTTKLPEASFDASIQSSFASETKPDRSHARPETQVTCAAVDPAPVIGHPSLDAQTSVADAGLNSPGAKMEAHTHKIPAPGRRPDHGQRPTAPQGSRAAVGSTSIAARSPSVTQDPCAGDGTRPPVLPEVNGEAAHAQRSVASGASSSPATWPPPTHAAPAGEALATDRAHSMHETHRTAGAVRPSFVGDQANFDTHSPNVADDPITDRSHGARDSHMGTAAVGPIPGGGQMGRDSQASLAAAGPNSDRSHSIRDPHIGPAAVGPTSGGGRGASDAQMYPAAGGPTSVINQLCSGIQGRSVDDGHQSTRSKTDSPTHIIGDRGSTSDNCQCRADSHGHLAIVGTPLPAANVEASTHGTCADGDQLAEPKQPPSHQPSPGSATQTPVGQATPVAQKFSADGAEHAGAKGYTRAHVSFAPASNISVACDGTLPAAIRGSHTHAKNAAGRPPSATRPARGHSSSAEGGTDSRVGQRTCETQSAAADGARLAGAIDVAHTHCASAPAPNVADGQSTRETRSRRAVGGSISPAAAGATGLGGGHSSRETQRLVAVAAQIPVEGQLPAGPQSGCALDGPQTPAAMDRSNAQASTAAGQHFPPATTSAGDHAVVAGGNSSARAMDESNTQLSCVPAPRLTDGQSTPETQMHRAVGGPTSQTSPATIPAADSHRRFAAGELELGSGHPSSDPQASRAAAAHPAAEGHATTDAHTKGAPGDPVSPAANCSTATQAHSHRAAGEPDLSIGQCGRDIQSCSADGEPKLGDGQTMFGTQGSGAVADQATTEGHREVGAHLTYALGGFLRDPVLGVLADVVDDLETVRIANENRVRILTRTGVDADGGERGFGLTAEHPEVAKLIATVKALAAAEHDAILNLQRAMRKHPLGPWVKRTPGVGEKQAARLLAAIGDPYFNDLHGRPRTVGELWAYAGFHVVDTSGSGPRTADTQTTCAAVGPKPHPDGHRTNDAQSPTAVGVAPKRTRGQKSNWSEDARKRAWLIAASCIKFANSPYRKVYDDAREKYSDTVHPTECVRCGPKGKPAQVGSPRSPGHQHAMALRLMSKAILRDLWIESRALHEARGEALS